jgi:S1-C subfamily serine protease
LGRAPTGRPSISLGWLGAIRRDALGRETFFLDAEFTPELDGSPAINLSGQIAGINVFRRDLNTGVMLPIEHAMTVAQAIRTDRQSAPQSSIGVEVQDLSDDMKRALTASQGILITQVTAGSTALKAGLKPMDIVVRADGKDMNLARDLTNFIQQSPPGTKLKLTIVRAGAEKEIEVETTAFNSSTSPTTITIRPGLELSPDRSARGVEITVVRAHSEAQKLGLQMGDRVQAINGIAVQSNSEIEQLQRRLPPDAPQLWLIRRGEQSFGVVVQEGGKGL